MSTTVIKAAGAGQELNNPNPIGQTPWTGEQSITASDNFYAVADFTAATAFDNISEYIHAYNFSMNLPSTAVVEGILARFERDADGTIADSQIRLTYNDTAIQFSDAKVGFGDWATSDATADYGGSSDLWNRNWTVSEINGTNFGVVLAAKATVGSSSIAKIDFVQIEVTYHNAFTESPTGGATCGGSAVVAFIDQYTASGGVVAGGHAPYSLPTILGSGGAVAGGVAEEGTYYSPTGGATVGGTADYYVIRRVKEWNFPLTGAQEVPTVDTTASGFASVDIIDGVLYWNISYTGLSGGFTGAHFHHGDPGFDGPIVIPIPPNSLDGTLSPMIGSRSIDSTQEAGIRAGEWYVNIHSTSYPGGEIRGQIWQFGAATGGVADTNFFDSIVGTGGVVAGGSAPFSAGLIASGGATTGGSATVTVDYNVNGSGGAVAAGFAFIDPYLPTGGAETGGSAIVNVYWNANAQFGGVVVGGKSQLPSEFTPSGGVVVNGGATVQRVFTIPEWSVDLDGTQIPAPNTNLDTTATAHADIWYDPKESRISWKVTYSGFTEDVSIARFRSGAPGETGPVTIDLFDFSDGTASGFTGMVQVTDDEAALLAGNWYLMLGTHDDKLRSQLWHFGVSIGGEAAVEPYYEIPSGGAVVGGEALVDPIWAEGGAVTGGKAGVTFADKINGTGGVVVSGTTLISLENIDATGGVVVGGDSVDSQVEANINGQGGAVTGGRAVAGIHIVPTGGVVCGGSATLEFVMNPAVSGGVVVGGESFNSFTYNFLSTGGVVCGGKSIIAIHIVATGGVVVAGDIVFKYTSNPVISGGAVTGGKARQTFFDYFDASGGVVVAGRARQEKIKFFQKFKQGYCRAMASDNICTVVEDTSEKLIIPHDEVSPDLDPNRFRIEHVPTWCELEEELQPYAKVAADCDAALAKIIIKRQNGIVPKKVRPSVARERQIAAAGEAL